MMRLAYACLSGLLLTASFPEMGKGVVAWFALVPLLVALRNLSALDGLRIGFLAGMVHYFSLLYWFIPFLTPMAHFPYSSVWVFFFSYQLTWQSMSGFFLWPSHTQGCPLADCFLPYRHYGFASNISGLSFSADSPGNSLVTHNITHCTSSRFQI